MIAWDEIARELHGHGFNLAADLQPRAVGGGDISAAWRIDAATQPVFIKTGGSGATEMFAAEAAGLNELASANAIRVPKVLAHGCAGDTPYIALEWLDFGRTTAASECLLGEQLAALHRTRAEQFGWHRDNTIGATHQPNNWRESWSDFYAGQRIGFQLELATSNGYDGQLQTLGQAVLEAIPELLAGHTPQPSLLHGDLWGGNWAVCDDVPVIFDPAVYYGDRETDLAMTRLFGGFGSAFYDAYNGTWPLPEGYEEREPLYRLYHVLNHVNLFGGGYASQACAIMRGLL